MSNCQQVSNNLTNDVFMSTYCAASRQQHVQRRVHVNLFFSIVTANTQKHVQRCVYINLLRRFFLSFITVYMQKKVQRGVYVYLLRVKHTGVVVVAVEEVRCWDRPRLSRFTDIKRSFVGSERGASPRNCHICIFFVAGSCGVHNTGDRQVPPVGRTNWSIFFSVLLKLVKNRSAFKISWSATQMYT